MRVYVRKTKVSSYNEPRVKFQIIIQVIHRISSTPTKFEFIGKFHGKTPSEI